MRLKTAAWLIGLTMIIVPFSFSCNVGGDFDMDMDIKALVTVLDENPPTFFETATFSMG